MNLEDEITSCELRLLEAFTRNDLGILDALIDDRCRFLLPNARVVSKSTVIENYRSGRTTIASVNVSERMIHVADDVATVSLIQELKGRSYETSFNARFRYLRVWKRLGSTWKVIATAGIEIMPDAAT